MRRQPRYRRTPGTRSAEVPPPAGAQGISDEELPAIREALEAYPTDEAKRAELEAEQVSEEDIRRILGG